MLGIEEDPDEDEDELQATVIKVAAGVGLKTKSDDISFTHHLGRQDVRGRLVIMWFCHRKKWNMVLRGN